MPRYQKCTMFHSFQPVTENISKCKRCGAEQITLPSGSVESLKIAATWVNYMADEVLKLDEVLRLAAARLLEITEELK